MFLNSNIFFHLKIFANCWPSATNFKSFSQSLEQFFLTVGQNNFGNKIPFFLGWHVDGNTVDLPHTFTIIHCIAANKHGPTLLVPLREIVASLTPEER